MLEIDKAEKIINDLQPIIDVFETAVAVVEIADKRMSLSSSGPGPTTFAYLRLTSPEESGIVGCINEMLLVEEWLYEPNRQISKRSISDLLDYYIGDGYVDRLTGVLCGPDRLNLNMSPVIAPIARFISTRRVIGDCFDWLKDLSRSGDLKKRFSNYSKLPKTQRRGLIEILLEKFEEICSQKDTSIECFRECWRSLHDRRLGLSPPYMMMILFDVFMSAWRTFKEDDERPYGEHIVTIAPECCLIAFMNLRIFLTQEEMETLTETNTFFKRLTEAAKRSDKGTSLVSIGNREFYLGFIDPGDHSEDNLLSKLIVKEDLEDSDYLFVNYEFPANYTQPDSMKHLFQFVVGEVQKTIETAIENKIFDFDSDCWLSKHFYSMKKVISESMRVIGFFVDCAKANLANRINPDDLVFPNTSAVDDVLAELKRIRSALIYKYGTKMLMETVKFANHSVAMEVIRSIIDIVDHQASLEGISPSRITAIRYATWNAKYLLVHGLEKIQRKNFDKKLNFIEQVCAFVTKEQHEESYWPYIPFINEQEKACVVRDKYDYDVEDYLDFLRLAFVKDYPQQNLCDRDLRIMSVLNADKDAASHRELVGYSVELKQELCSELLQAYSMEVDDRKCQKLNDHFMDFANTIDNYFKFKGPGAKKEELLALDYVDLACQTLFKKIKPIIKKFYRKCEKYEKYFFIPSSCPNSIEQLQPSLYETEAILNLISDAKVSSTIGEESKFMEQMRDISDMLNEWLTRSKIELPNLNRPQVTDTVKRLAFDAMGIDDSPLDQDDIAYATAYQSNRTAPIRYYGQKTSVLRRLQSRKLRRDLNDPLLGANRIRNLQRMPNRRNDINLIWPDKTSSELQDDLEEFDNYLFRFQQDFVDKARVVNSNIGRMLEEARLSKKEVSDKEHVLSNSHCLDQVGYYRARLFCSILFNLVNQYGGNSQVLKIQSAIDKAERLSRAVQEHVKKSEFEETSFSFLIDDLDDDSGKNSTARLVDIDIKRSHGEERDGKLTSNVSDWIEETDTEFYKEVADRDPYDAVDATSFVFVISPSDEELKTIKDSKPTPETMMKIKAVRDLYQFVLSQRATDRQPISSDLGDACTPNINGKIDSSADYIPRSRGGAIGLIGRTVGLFEISDFSDYLSAKSVVDQISDPRVPIMCTPAGDQICTMRMSLKPMDKKNPLFENCAQNAAGGHNSIYDTIYKDDKKSIGVYTRFLFEVVLYRVNRPQREVMLRNSLRSMLIQTVKRRLDFNLLLQIEKSGMDINMNIWKHLEKLGKTAPFGSLAAHKRKEWIKIEDKGTDVYFSNVNLF